MSCTVSQAWLRSRTGHSFHAFGISPPLPYFFFSLSLYYHCLFVLIPRCSSRQPAGAESASSFYDTIFMCFVRPPIPRRFGSLARSVGPRAVTNLPFLFPLAPARKAAVPARSPRLCFQSPAVALLLWCPRRRHHRGTAAAAAAEEQGGALYSREARRIILFGASSRRWVLRIGCRLS